jgi:ankyrin repeat protein
MFAKNDPEKLSRAIESALSIDEIFTVRDDDGNGNHIGNSLFNAAVRWGNAETVKACVTGGAGAYYYGIGNLQDIVDHALKSAISRRNADTVKALLDAGANAEIVYGDKWDLRANVFPEAETGNPSPEVLEYKRYLDSGEEILKVLKERRARFSHNIQMKMKPSFVGIGNILYRDEVPCIVLDTETLQGAVSPEALKLRVASCSDVDERDDENWTALHYIAYGNYFDRDAMIEILLDAGAAIDAGGGPNFDITPLMLAAARVREDARYLETIKLFLKRGANLKAKTKEKKTAPQWAADWRRYVTHGHVTDGEKSMLLEIIGELDRAFGRSNRKRRSSRREIDVDLMTGAFWMRPEKLAEILSRGADVNVRSENGYTPLMFASIYNKADAVKFLIDSGADPTARNTNGDAPLLLAAGNRAAKIAEALPKRDVLGPERKEEKEAGIISIEEQNFLRHGLLYEKDTGCMSFKPSYDSVFRLNDEESLVKAVKNGLNVTLGTEDSRRFFEAAKKITRRKFFAPASK